MVNCNQQLSIIEFYFSSAKLKFCIYITPKPDFRETPYKPLAKMPEMCYTKG